LEEVGTGRGLSEDGAASFLIVGSGAQGLKGLGVQGFRGSGVQGLRGSGVHGLRGSGAQGLSRGLGVQGSHFVRSSIPAMQISIVDWTSFLNTAKQLNGTKDRLNF